MVRWLLVGLASLFFACASSQMVETRGRSAFGPINESQGGRVKYMLGGADFVLKARREDAYKQMYHQCSGRYSITREWDEDGETVTSSYATANGTSSVRGYGNASGFSAKGSTSVVGTGVAFSAVQQYRVIDFSCEPTHKK